MLHYPTHLTTPKLTSLKGIRHGFFGREGGVSTGLYESLNTGPGSNDDPAAVEANRAIVAKAIGAETPDHLISLYQFHSATTLTLEKPFASDDRPQGDAMVTNTPGLALCVLTADCTPVLFCDPEAQVIGAAHAGWKGALGGVIESTITAMKELGATPANIHAAIGPSLSQTSFEVGPDLRQPFLDKHGWCDPLFAPGEADRSYFDIWGFCEGVLQRQGVGHIECLGEDTLSQPKRYFSNRWRVRQNQSDYGRNASVIMLTDLTS